MPRPPLLILLANAHAIERPGGRVVLHGRMVSGAFETQRAWGGRLMIVLEPKHEESPVRPLVGDEVEWDRDALPFELQVLPFDTPHLRPLLSRADLIHAGLNHRTVNVSRIAQELRIPCTYGTEYSLRTRLQIVRAENANPLLRARRALFAVHVERKQRAAIALADGVQCAGTPTYEAYKDLTSSALLFFDGRLTPEMRVTAPMLEARLATLATGRPLRMLYAGRLIKMKGADHLVEVGRRLAGKGVPFELDIYGTGDLVPEMKETIERHGLQSKVRMMGYAPYEALMERARREYDLFLCCHPQGDPSGAYIETLGNGLPIVGYANEAVAGMRALCNFGKLVPIGDAEAVARTLAELAHDRQPLREWARNAAQFSEDHTVDKVFDRRGAHFRSVLERSRAGSAARAS